MRNDHVNRRQLGAWLFAGLTAPIAQFAGGMSWQTAALLAVMCLSVCCLLSRSLLIPGKWLGLTEYGWLIYILMSAGGWIAGSWSDGNVYPAVPLMLLAMGAASSCRGSGIAARAGSVVFWLVALLYSIVLTAGVEQLDLTELNKFEEKLDPRLIVALLIPALAVFLTKDQGDLPFGAGAGPAVFAVLLSVLVTGSLSARVAVTAEMPLFEWVEGLNLAGAVQRFEALVSVALTMGWFALVSFLLCIAGQLADNIRSDSYCKGTWFAAAAAGIGIICRVPGDSMIIAAVSMVLWVLAPGIGIIRMKIKSLKK